MSYAILNDLQGWRSVAAEADCTEDEHYSATQPDPVVVIVAPNEVARQNRAEAFALELDNLQRKFARGEDGITLNQVQDKAAEIRARFPYEATT
jgi:hypothetical protein